MYNMNFCDGVQDTRVSRGDGGSVFVLVKDVSFSIPSDLPPTTTAVVGPIDPSTPTALSAPAPYLSVSLLLPLMRASDLNHTCRGHAQERLLDKKS